MSQPRTVTEVVDAQSVAPVYIVGGCCENALDDREGLGRDVFRNLGLSHEGNASPDEPDDFYPLTPSESFYVAEDATDGPFGGAEMRYAMIFKGRKFITPTVMVCFDGPDRPFSVESYGGIYENKDVALSEAKRLAEYAKPQMEAYGGFVYLDNEVTPDAHGVCLMFPAESVVKTFDVAKDDARYDLFKGLVASVIKGFIPQPSKLTG